MRFGLPKIAFKKPLSMLFLAVLTMHLADYIIIPILPVILSINKGLPPDKIGFIIAAGSLSFQIGSIIGGLISDRIGRKITLVVGSIIEVVALLGFGLSNHFTYFLLFETLNGIGGGIYAPTVKAAIAEYSQDSSDTRTTAFSLRGMAANLGIAVGGLIPLIFIGFQFSTYFFISSAIYILLLLLSLFFIPNTCEEKKCGNTSIKRYTDIFKNKPFLIFSIVTMLVWAVYAQLGLLLPLRASSIFKNGKIVGSIWTITSLFVVVLQTPIAIHILKKINLIKAIAIGCFIMGLGLFFIGYSNTYMILLLAALVFIIGEMLVTPTIDSLTSEYADQEIIGAYFSLANIIYGLGTALGTFVIGELIKAYGIKSSYLWFIVLISSIVVSVIVYFSKKFLPTESSS